MASLELNTLRPEHRYAEPIAHDYFNVPSPRATFDEDPNEDDIYRGPRSPSRESRRAESVSSSSSSTSSSSSSSSVFGGRLGAISTLVEHAITRWARARDSTDSLSTTSSSTTTASSIVTVSRSYLSRRRRRRTSLADVHNAKSEREVAARLRAREEARQIPREFVLYSPLASSSERPSPRHAETHDDQPGVLRTTSLSLILSELSVSLKANNRTRRAHDLARGTISVPQSRASPVGSNAVTPSLPHQDYMLPEELFPGDATPPDEARVRKRGRKGKQRATPELANALPRVSRTPSGSDMDKAWWLDVSSPSWEDMRAIGKLLHLHPLTLEDILQQDPREKLELFPKLGYYFVVFRAIESQKTREKRRLMSTISTTDTHPGLFDEGIVGEVNVYLVVFREGICSFHFSDISEHTDAVRSKVLMYAESGPVTMSSDWIAHGVMDSIVDSFFPFLDGIEKEVMSIEELVFTDDQNLDLSLVKNRASSARSSGSDTAVSSNTQETQFADTLNEKIEPRSPLRTHFSVPNRPLFSLRRARQFFRRLQVTLSQVNVKVKRSSQTPVNATTIQRVAHMRRLVTSLTRVLATKSEVVASVKKRLLMTGESGLGNGTVDDHDVFVYMGDVQDHILTLQQSLAHYERMLSQSHPTYMTHLRLSASKAKSGSDKAIVILSIISMAILSVQSVIGFHSMNIHVPHNSLGTDRYNVFAIVLAISLLVLILYGSIVRWWWVTANKKRQRW